MSEQLENEVAQLENENAELKSKLATAEAELFNAKSSQQICVGAAGIGDFSELCGWIDAKKSELSALREDKARLDWLFVWIRAHWNQFPYKSRQAIDAARKENT